MPTSRSHLTDPDFDPNDLLRGRGQDVSSNEPPVPPNDQNRIAVPIMMEQGPPQAPTATGQAPVELVPRSHMKYVPSHMKPYPPGSSITYRPYSHGELDYFSQSTLPLEQIYREYLEGIFTTGFDKRLLTLADFLYTCVHRKLDSSVGDHLVYVNECLADGCEHMFNEVIHLTDLDFSELEVPDLPIRWETDRDVLTFTPLTVGDLLFLETVDTKKFKSPRSRWMAVQCRNLKFQQAYDRFYWMTDPEEIKTLREIDGMLFHGVDYYDLKCPECSYLNRIDIDEGGGIYIHPFRESIEPKKARISFGQAPTHPTV